MVDAEGGAIFTPGSQEVLVEPAFIPELKGEAQTSLHALHKIMRSLHKRLQYLQKILQPLRVGLPIGLKLEQYLFRVLRKQGNLGEESATNEPGAWRELWLLTC